MGKTKAIVHANGRGHARCKAKAKAKTLAQDAGISAVPWGSEVPKPETSDQEETIKTPQGGEPSASKHTLVCASKHTLVQVNKIMMLQEVGGQCKREQKKHVAQQNYRGKAQGAHKPQKADRLQERDRKRKREK